MNYEIELKGKIIATFEELEDAEHFLEYKRERLLFERNSEILDKIAEENNLDRRYPGTFSNAIVMPYYDKAREQVNQDCRLVSK